MWSTLRLLILETFWQPCVWLFSNIFSSNHVPGAWQPSACERQKRRSTQSHQSSTREVDEETGSNVKQWRSQHLQQFNQISGLGSKSESREFASRFRDIPAPQEVSYIFPRGCIQRPHSPASIFSSTLMDWSYSSSFPLPTSLSIKWRNMRPHTRTQCQDSSRCEQCNSDGSEGPVAFAVPASVVRR